MLDVWAQLWDYTQTTRKRFREQRSDLSGDYKPAVLLVVVKCHLIKVKHFRIRSHFCSHKNAQAKSTRQNKNKEKPIINPKVGRDSQNRVWKGMRESTKNDTWFLYFLTWEWRGCLREFQNLFEVELLLWYLELSWLALTTNRPFIGIKSLWGHDLRSKS